MAWEGSVGVLRTPVLHLSHPRHLSPVVLICRGLLLSRRAGARTDSKFEFSRHRTVCRPGGLTTQNGQKSAEGWRPAVFVARFRHWAIWLVWCAGVTQKRQTSRSAAFCVFFIIPFRTNLTSWTDSCLVYLYNGFHVMFVHTLKNFLQTENFLSVSSIIQAWLL